ncbi:MAG: PEP-CTERM sorting domain-containing protein, partial [Planctomycetaceae bacterium]
IGAATGTISGFTLDHSESSPSLDIVPGSGFASDFTWALGSGVNASSISGSNFADHTIDTSGTQLLGTLQYTLDQSFTSGSIPIDLTFNSAQRDGFNSIPASEITVTGGTLDVSASNIPEPSSLVVLALGAIGFWGLRLHRQTIKDCGRSQSA